MQCMQTLHESLPTGSVYTEFAPRDARTDNPVYNTVQAILDTLPDGRILDIGASDGVANHHQRLQDTENVVGIDLSMAALRCNDTETTILADAATLPFKDDVFDHVIALDVLEHLTPRRALLALQEIRRTGTDHHTLIASMPIISPTRCMTWKEALQVVNNRKRPDLGLFDKTHRILAGPLVHQTLFHAAGYVTSAAYDTLAHTKNARRVTGPDILTAVQVPEGNGKIVRLAQRLETVRSPFLSGALAHVLAYQRIYVLQQKQVSNPTAQ